MTRRFITLALLAWGLSAGAQSLVDARRDSVIASHKVISFGSGNQVGADSVRRLIEEFYYDQFRSFSDPEAPYFLFMSRDATLAMGIGGCVRMRGYFDWHGAQPTPAFNPYLIPMTPDPTAMRHFGTTPSGTSLFFRILGRNKRLGHYQLYIQADFSGYNSRDFKLKKAYAIVNDWTIGYAASTFSDPAAQPPMVDSNGASNKITPTDVLVRYSPRLSKHWLLAVSAETPSTTVNADGVQTKAIQNWVPDGAAFIQYEWGRSNHVRLAGIVRSLSYRNLTSGTNHHQAGWAVTASSVAHPTPQLTTYLTTNYGHGYASLGGDLSAGSYDLLGYPGESGRLYAPASVGWCAGLQWNFRPELFVSLSASSTRLHLKDSGSQPDEYKRGLMATANCFWNVTARIQVAAEFCYGRRYNFSGTHRSAYRVGALAQFSF
ncbi:MAG: DcaP family trimeric outer membrane transporter [Bacteroides sp.]|nr:DcaP family trimeric outer membrane transporter [Bacteroides sp.]MCM1378488.1 DcaP family trimeric outer membrane transporter [Bacteroides sp.]MCM1444789.1 DcaP family trimeric outer membrane transporter [Prevotella sp.]